MLKKVLIVEDHPIVNESLSHFILKAVPGLECFSAYNGKQGLAYLNGNPIDLILLDVKLPDMSGIEFCAVAKARYPAIKVLGITSYAQRHIVEQMLASGADGFVLKTSDVSDIIEGVLTVMEGKQYLGPWVSELLNGKSSDNNENPMITRREHEILRLIADGLTNHQIAGKLYISESTVDSHRKNLLLKFNAKNTAILIRTASSKGLLDG